jgi:serine/threonine protein kinase
MVSIPVSQPSHLTPGFKLDRYELLCPIAEGGMASVWIARQTGKHGFEKLVAIKTILPKFASDPGFQTMFLDEARIAARIEHANVAQVLDVGEQHGTTYLVMEYVDGEALSGIHRAVKKKGARMPTGVLLRVMADVCGGLHTAHELRGDDGQLLGVVHRDVSPQNILVNMKGVAKLIDFGIAKARDRVAGDTNAGTLKGKVRYMAPEQALGNPIDRRADVWAIGAILYHLLSGKAPYEGENDVQTLLVLTSGRPPVPLPPSVHPAISAVVKRALAAVPDKRFDTAAAMQQAIEDAMVEAKLIAGASVVSTCLREQVGDRAQKRKDAIALGVKAAADREKYSAIMRSNIKRTGGLSEGGSGSGVATAGGLGAPSFSETVPMSGGGSLAPPETPSAISKSTNGTLGLAALDVSLKRQGRSRTAAIAGVAVGVAMGIAGLVTLVTRDSPGRGAAKSGGADPSLSASAIKTVSVEDLPTAAPTPTQETPAVSAPAATPEPTGVATAVAVPTVPAVAPVIQMRPTPRAPPPRPTSKKRIDDGF